MYSIDRPLSGDLDLISSRLRAQIRELNRVLHLIEQTNSYEQGFITQTLKLIENEIRFIRKNTIRNY